MIIIAQQLICGVRCLKRRRRIEMNRKMNVMLVLPAVVFIWCLTLAVLSCGEAAPKEVEVTTFAGSGEKGYAAGTGTKAQFYSPFGLAFDKAGNLYVADQNNHRIRKISPNGEVTTFAGSGEEGDADGTGAEAQFYYPRGLAFDKAGNLYVADMGNSRIRKISPKGKAAASAGSGGSAGGSTGARALAGTWEEVDTGIIWSFTGNKFTQEMMGIKQTVPYKVKGNSISTEYEGAEIEIDFEIDGDTLTVDIMGYELEFERIK
jgi:hypothetical protein